MLALDLRSNLSKSKIFIELKQYLAYPKNKSLLARHVLHTHAYTTCPPHAKMYTPS